MTARPRCEPNTHRDIIRTPKGFRTLPYVSSTPDGETRRCDCGVLLTMPYRDDEIDDRDPDERETGRPPDFDDSGPRDARR